MATGGRESGGSALVRLRDHLDSQELRCPACGYVGEGGGWRAVRTPGAVRFTRRCPSCDARDSRRLADPE